MLASWPDTKMLSCGSLKLSLKSPQMRQGFWRGKFTRLHDREARSRWKADESQGGIEARTP